MCIRDRIKTIHVTLKYGADKNEKVITGIKRISKPGLRVYAGKDEIPSVPVSYTHLVLILILLKKKRIL